MKIILVSVGTRGDMEPFLAIGEILQERGHRIICAFPEQFRHLVDDTPMEFASLGARFIELLESDAGKIAMGGGSGFGKFLATLKLASEQTEANKELVQKQHEIIEREEPDRIVYNGKATYPVIWELDHPGKSIMISPLPYMHYVRDHAHVAFNTNLGPLLNRLTYALATFGLVATLKISARWEDVTRMITRKELRDVLENGKVIYTVSLSLFRRPDYWHEDRHVLGFHQKGSTGNWQPDDALVDFLERHNGERILFFTFGSMTNPNPAEKTAIIVDILQRNRIPALINTASGGLVEPDAYDSDLLHFVPRIPYDWIFPRVYAVIHHGGSGTTHLGLAYGCASLIVPHIIDQFVWDKRLATLGVGPKGVKINHLSMQRLEPKILDLLNNDTYKAMAQQIAGEMANEAFEEALYQTIVAE